MSDPIRLGLWILSILPLMASTLRADVPAFQVTTDRTIDAHSLESIVHDVIAQAGGRRMMRKRLRFMNICIIRFSTAPIRRSEHRNQLGR